MLEDNKVIKKVSNLRIPKVLSWGGQRFQKHLKSEGLFGRHSKGVGNKIILNSDLVIAVGCSLLQHQTGKIEKKFAPNAKIIFVNTSKNEINRAKYFFGKRFYGVEADALDFLKEVIKKRSFLTLSKKLNLDNIDNNKVKIIPPIKIIHKFLSSVSKDYIVFSDAGATLSWTYQAANLLKHPPEIYTSFNLHSMGYANCAAIGAANKKKKILVIIGDGSIPMNSQELIHCKNKNIKFLILDNEGYGIIRQTQKDFYKSSFLGSDFRDKSAHLPKFSVEKILKSFELKTSIINEKQIENFNLKKFLLFKDSSALICKINYFHRVEEDI